MPIELRIEELNSREKYEPVCSLHSLALAIRTQFEFDSSGETLQKQTTTLPNLGSATPVIHLQRQNMYVRNSLTQFVRRQHEIYEPALPEMRVASGRRSAKLRAYNKKKG